MNNMTHLHRPLDQWYGKRECVEYLILRGRLLAFRAGHAGPQHPLEVVHYHRIILLNDLVQCLKNMNDL